MGCVIIATSGAYIKNIVAARGGRSILTDPGLNTGILPWWQPGKEPGLFKNTGSAVEREEKD